MMDAPPRPYRLPRWAQRGRLRWTWLGGRGLPLYKRSGACVETFTWLEDWFAHSFEPATISRLRQTGLNLVTIPYFSGFGPRCEAAWMNEAADLALRCQREGIRVLAAIDLGGVALETVPLETPEVREWLLQGADGRVLTAEPGLYWRALPDLTHPGYREWIGHIIDQALDVGFDGIWLHDVEPRRGYGPAAVAEWRRFISGYTDFYRRKCGYTDYALLDPPPVEAPGDPLWLDWDDFWQTRFVDALADYNQRVKQRDPERLTVVSGPFQEQFPWERYRLHVDAVHVANPWQPGVEHGEVTSQAALYLLSDAADVLAFGDGVRRRAGSFGDLPTAEQVELSLAEGLFFGGQPVSAPWACLPEGNDAAAPWAAVGRLRPWHCAVERPDRMAVCERFLKFAECTAGLHQSAESAATIAILHSRDSLRFDREATVLNLRAAQLACLRRHLPADVLVSDDLAKLDRYDVLIVPEQPCLSRVALERIASWVRVGGGLVLVGEAAVRARRGRLRPPDWLVTSLGIGGHRWSLPNAEVVPAGNGRVLALPALGVEPFAYPLDAADPSAGWEWLTDAVTDVSAWPLPVTVEGPDTVFCRAYRLPDGNLTITLLNYDAPNAPAELVLVLNLDWPSGPPEVVYHDPSEAEGVTLVPRRDGPEVRVPLPPLDVYAVVEVRDRNGSRPRELALAEELPGFEPASR